VDACAIRDAHAAAVQQRCSSGAADWRVQQPALPRALLCTHVVPAVRTPRGSDTLPPCRSVPCFRPAMLCHAMPCHAMPCRAMPCLQGVPVRLLTRKLPRSCPEAAEKLSRSCLEATQKLPRSCPEAVQKLPRSWPAMHARARPCTPMRAHATTMHTCSRSSTYLGVPFWLFTRKKTSAAAGSAAGTWTQDWIGLDLQV
jgi:hypothetical protein